MTDEPRPVRKVLTTFLLVLMLISPALGQLHLDANQQKQFERLMGIAQQCATCLWKGNYLAALALWRDFVDHDRPDPKSPVGSWGAQGMAGILVAVGRLEEAQRLLNSAPDDEPARPEPSSATIDAARAVPLQSAEAVVMEAVRTHQIVLLNENHQVPEHRAFAARLLPRLKLLGVKYLAVESAGQTNLDAAMKSGHVTLNTDAYCYEPQRAALLRAAAQNGFHLVAFDFETPEEQELVRKDPFKYAGLREDAMARNLQEVLARDPGAKMLVWEGFGHVCKSVMDVRGTKLELMALRLWRRTGIEPYSIYQLSDTGDTRHDDPTYALLVKAAGQKILEPRALTLPPSGASKTDTVYGTLTSRGVDAIILHPPDPFDHGVERPRWLVSSPGIDVRGIVKRSGKPCPAHLVQAVILGEDDTAAPVDQVLTDDGGRYVLHVPNGRYQLRVWCPHAESAVDVGQFTGTTALQRDIDLP